MGDNGTSLTSGMCVCILYLPLKFPLQHPADWFSARSWRK